MGIGIEFFSLMDKIGYRFSDLEKLQTALTHSSYTNEMKSKGFRAESNETMEFLGDAVLEIVVSEFLFDRYREHGEGRLTEIRKNVVCESSLADVAKKLSLGDYLNIGTGDEGLDTRNKPKVLANTLEAIFGAVYLDDRENGFSEYRAVILNLLADRIDYAVKHASFDCKSKLQQLVEKSGDSLLRYDCEEYGPDHEKTFLCSVYIDNNKVGEGKGSTKRQAQNEAAKVALKLFGIE